VKIGGLLRFSALDYPGKLSCVVFCQGCPLRCVYCHNPEFQPYSTDISVDFQELLDFLKSRYGYLDAVVFSGGEPLLQSDLAQIIESIKDFGFLVGIHTSGVVPDMFEKIITLVDWVGFDIKTVFRKYNIITKSPNSGQLAEVSLKILLDSRVNCEIRTTYDPRFIFQDDIFEIAEILQRAGVQEWVIQECVIRETSEVLSLPNRDVIEKASELIRISLRHQ
jgi:pyruvate formate lyase activating enzyme